MSVTKVQLVSNVSTGASFAGIVTAATFRVGTAVSAGTTAAPSISPTGDSNTGIFFPSADTIAFAEGGAEAMRVDSSGRLLVGTSTSASTGTSQYALLQVQGWNGASTGEGIFSLQRGESSSAMSSDDPIGDVLFSDKDGGNYARISAFADAAPAAVDHPGRLVFSTTADGAASPTEAMRINNQQELLVGTATRNANGGILQLKSGITFPATAVAASDANTLDDYEEGTWSVVDRSGAGLTLTTNGSIYIKIGKLVYCHADVTFPSTVSTATIALSLPFVPTGVPYAQGGTVIRNNKALLCSTFTVPDSGGSTIFLRSGLYTNYQANVDMSSGMCNFSMTYQTS